MQSASGTYRGLALPQYTLCGEFAQAGFKITSEYTSGEKQ